MNTGRRFSIGFMAMAFALAGGCGEDETTGPATNGEPPEPPAVSAPASPTDVSVTVQSNRAWIRWTPGVGARTHEVVLSNMDGVEPDRINEIGKTTKRDATFDHLTWGASYRVVVVAINEVGRAETAPTIFEIPIPHAPVLTWFSATRDPTCLTVEWSAYGPEAGVQGIRVELTGTSESASFEEVVDPLNDSPLTMSLSPEAVFCGSDYPIIDRMTYTARVVAEFDGLELASDTREFTVDFDPDYSLTGVWRVLLYGSGTFSGRLDLVDLDGDISGSWTGGGDVTGTRIAGDLHLLLERDDFLVGYFEGPNRVHAGLWLPPGFAVSLERD